VVALKSMALWPQVRSPRFALLLLTVAFCLVRARDQPSIDVGIGGTTAAVVPGDILLAALTLVSVVAIANRGLKRELWLPVAAAAVFSLILVGSAAANGAAALVSGIKVTELTALGLGAALFLTSRRQLEALVDLLLVFTLAADAIGAVRFLTSGGRQASFLGEHDFAALATLPLLYGLAVVFSGGSRGRAAIAIGAGGVGCILGAALASLLGLYLGTLALILVAWRRRWVTRTRLVVAAGVIAVVTAGTLGLRAGELGFLQSWFGKPATRPGQYAASWSQRLIYAYVGGRVFLAHPGLGTGWYGELPPKEFTAYLPAARRRFSDQPPNYFPPADKPFIPQQTWDQILYELGLVGAAAMVGTLAGLFRSAVRAARRATSVAASLPVAWLAGSIGALAGEGLFGGTPLAATFWLVGGVVLALSSVTFAE
jgi:O-antigen ligase